jgi:uncharacterized membrane protein
MFILIEVIEDSIRLIISILKDLRSMGLKRSACLLLVIVTILIMVIMTISYQKQYPLVTLLYLTSWFLLIYFGHKNHNIIDNKWTYSYLYFSFEYAFL